jgi:hypothetical protein
MQYGRTLAGVRPAGPVAVVKSDRGPGGRVYGSESSKAPANPPVSYFPATRLHQSSHRHAGQGRGAGRDLPAEKACFGSHTLPSLTTKNVCALRLPGCQQPLRLNRASLPRPAPGFTRTHRRGRTCLPPLRCGRGDRRVAMSTPC